MIEYLRSDGDVLNIEYETTIGVDSVVFNVYDLDLEEYIQSDEAVYSSGSTFIMTLNSEVTAYDRRVRIEIQAIDANTYVEDEIYASIIRPYATPEEIADYADLTIVSQNPGFNEVTESKLLKEERKARLFIDAILGAPFVYQYKNVATSGQGTDTLYLGQRIEFFDKIVKDDEVLYDEQEDIDLLEYPVVPSSSKFNLKIVASGENISEWTDIAVLNNPGYFEKNSTYVIRGGYGWKYIPSEINQAICELVTDMLCNNYSYRKNNIKSISNDSFNIQLDNTSTTGNIIVDELISRFKRFDIWAI